MATNNFARNIGGQVSKPSWIDVASHTLFFGSFFVIYNPFFVLDTVTKYIVFIGMFTVAAGQGLFKSSASLVRELAIVGLFFLFYGMAVLRINDVQYERYGDSTSLSIQQAIVTLMAITCSVFFARALNLSLAKRVLFWLSAPTALWIAYNFAELSDYTLRDTYVLGNLAYRGYQTNSLLLAIAGLVACVQIDYQRITRIANLLYAAVFLICSYYLFQGLGRGEALAYVVAVSLYHAPRLTLLAAPFAYAIFTFLVNTVDTPLTERLRVILEGDFGTRDELLWRSIDLLIESPMTIFTGGGLNYFQHFWGFTSGNYPHNALLEALISGGLGLFLVVFFVFFVSLIRAYAQIFRGRLTPDQLFAFSFATMLSIVALKSGALVSFWDVGLFTCFFLVLKTYPKAEAHTQWVRQYHRPHAADPRFAHLKDSPRYHSYPDPKVGPWKR